MAHLTMARIAGDVLSVPAELADPRHVIVYRSCFDQRGFCDMTPINQVGGDAYARYRSAYRKLWLDDLGGYEVASSLKPEARASLRVVEPHIEGLVEVAACAEKGQQLIRELVYLVKDISSPAAKLGMINKEISELDRHIEELGFHYGSLGPISRMFIFAKENLQGSDPLDLASQMERVYQDLERRCRKFERYYIDS
jgi:hypothetical protein